MAAFCEACGDRWRLASFDLSCFTVYKEWRHPEHETFRPRNAWSLSNAFTDVYREINPHTVLRRGQALHGLFDAVVGMS